jgi:hypothetical protein
MRALDELLDPGEAVVFRTGLHRSALCGIPVTVIPAVVFAARMRTAPSEHGVPPLLVAVAVVIAACTVAATVIAWRTTEIAVTGKRVLGRRGLRGRTFSIPIAAITEVRGGNFPDENVLGRRSALVITGGKKHLLAAVGDVPGFISAVEGARAGPKGR